MPPPDAYPLPIHRLIDHTKTTRRRQQPQPAAAVSHDPPLLPPSLSPMSSGCLHQHEEELCLSVCLLVPAADLARWVGVAACPLLLLEQRQWTRSRACCRRAPLGGALTWAQTAGTTDRQAGRVRE